MNTTDTLAARPDVITVTAKDMPTEYAVHYVTTEKCIGKDHTFSVECDSLEAAQEEIDSLSNDPTVEWATISCKYTKTDEWGEEIEITEAEYREAMASQAQAEEAAEAVEESAPASGDETESAPAVKTSYYVTMRPEGALYFSTQWFDDPDEREIFILGMRERGYRGVLFAGEEVEEVSASA